MCFSPWGCAKSDMIWRLNNNTSKEECKEYNFNYFPVRFPVQFNDGSDGKASSRNAGHPGSIPGSGRSPGEGNGNPLQYSCLENPMDGGAWWATVHGVAESWTRLSNFMDLTARWIKNRLVEKDTVMKPQDDKDLDYRQVAIKRKLNVKCFYSYPLLTEILYPPLNRATHTRPGLDTVCCGKELLYHLLKS